MGGELRKYKVVLLGDAGVGKTSLVTRYVHQTFGKKYLKTLGTNIYTKEVVECRDGQTSTSILQVWDVMGQKILPSLLKTAMKGATGALFVCDLTNLESLNNLKDWIQLVFDNCEEIAFIFLANKSDIQEQEFGFYSVKAFADMFNAPFYVTSAKTGAGVEEAFLRIASLSVNRKFVPKECWFDLGAVKEMVPLILLAEDQIINAYCGFLGGYEIGMPHIQEGFKHLEIDFEDPSRDDLEILMTHLLSEAKYSLEENDYNKLRDIFDDLTQELDEA